MRLSAPPRWPFDNSKSLFSAGSGAVPGQWLVLRARAVWPLARGMGQTCASQGLQNGPLPVLIEAVIMNIAGLSLSIVLCLLDLFLSSIKEELTIAHGCDFMMPAHIIPENSG